MNNMLRFVDAGSETDKIYIENLCTEDSQNDFPYEILYLNRSCIANRES
jgi:hypothetical protein